MRDFLNWIVKNNLDVKISKIASVIEIDSVNYFFMKDRKRVVKYSTKSKSISLNLSKEERSIIESQNIEYAIFKMGTRYFYTSVKEDSGVEFNQFRYLGKDVSKTSLILPNLGIRGPFELTNGSGAYEDWVKKAKFLGIEVLGICEKNTLAGSLPFQLECEKEGLKSVIGETISVRGVNDIYEVILYVFNKDGWQNLLRINKQINVDNVDDRVVDEDFVISKSSGLYCVISTSTTLNDKIVKKYKDGNFKNVFYQFDLSRYNSPDRDSFILSNISHYYKNYSSKLGAVIINNSFYLEKEYAHMKHKLNKIGKIFEYQSEDQYFKSSKEIVKTIRSVFSKESDFRSFISGAFVNTVEIEKCDFKIEINSFKLPEYRMLDSEILKYNNSRQDMLLTLCMKGLDEKIIKKNFPSGKTKEEYHDRIKEEFRVIKKGGFIDYFLILWDICQYADRVGILRGIGRGSAGGSLIAYLMDLTRLDPLQYDLIFERFLNEGRIGGSLPDIDTDFSGQGRDDIKRYMEDRYGVHNVCSIGTYGTFKPRQALQDLCRLEKVPPQTVNYFSSLISKDSSNYGHLFRDAASSDALKKFFNENFETIEDILSIDGQYKTQSVHAAGVIITPDKSPEGDKMEIYDWIPVKKMDGVLVSEWEGPLLEKAGYLKEDILGIKQLDKFDSIFKLMEAQGKKIPLFEEIDYNDPNVLKMFCEGFNQDLFHFGSHKLSKYTARVKPDNFEHLIAIISLYRTGVMESGGHELFIKLKNGEIEPEYDFGMESITKSTLSILVYQEQAMRAVQELGGMSLVEADNVRKAMGKKIMSKMKEYESIFLKGAINNGCDEFEASVIWNKLAAFAKYGFNRSHAAAYAMTGYFCQYLKYYHPMEYWTTSLSYASSDDVTYRLGEIQDSNNGITIAGPNINKSGDSFKADFSKKTIYWSIRSIDQVGPMVMAAISEERDSNGYFYSFEEFFKRIDRSVVNKRVMVNMILSGCFDEICGIDNSTCVTKRLDIIRELERLIGDDISIDLVSKSDYITLQKNLCGYGFLDFYEISAKSGISDASNKYVDPVAINSENNLGCHIVTSGIVHDLNIRKSKRGDFAKIILDNNNGIVEITLWNDSWEIFSDILSESKGKIVSLSGTIIYDQFSGCNTIVVNESDQVVSYQIKS